MNINDIYTDDFEYCNAISSKLNELDKEQLIDLIGLLNETVKTLSRVSKQDAQTKLLHKTATEVKIKDYLSTEDSLLSVYHFLIIHNGNTYVRDLTSPSAFLPNPHAMFYLHNHEVCG